MTLGPCTQLLRLVRALSQMMESIGVDKHAYTVACSCADCSKGCVHLFFESRQAPSWIAERARFGVVVEYFSASRMRTQAHVFIVRRVMPERAAGGGSRRFDTRCNVWLCVV